MTTDPTPDPTTVDDCTTDHLRDPDDEPAVDVREARFSQQCQHPWMPDRYVAHLINDHHVEMTRVADMTMEAVPSDPRVAAVDIEFAFETNDDAAAFEELATDYAMSLSDSRDGLLHVEREWPVIEHTPNFVTRGKPTVTLGFRGGIRTHNTAGVVSTPYTEFADWLVYGYGPAADDETDEADDEDCPRCFGEDATLVVADGEDDDVAEAIEHVDLVTDEAEITGYTDSADDGLDAAQLPAGSVEYTGSFEAKTPADVAREIASAMGASTGDDDDSESDDADVDDGVGGIPACPECDEQDARQLATGEWVCQECTHVWEVSD